MATSSKPLMSSGKNGFVMYDTISPRMRLRPDTSARALRVGVVAQLLDDFPDPLSGLRVDQGRVVDGTGNGGSRDAGAPRNLLDLHYWPPPAVTGHNVHFAPMGTLYRVARP